MGRWKLVAYAPHFQPWEAWAHKLGFTIRHMGQDWIQWIGVDNPGPEHHLLSWIRSLAASKFKMDSTIKSDMGLRISNLWIFHGIFNRFFRVFLIKPTEKSLSKSNRWLRPNPTFWSGSPKNRSKSWRENVAQVPREFVHFDERIPKDLSLIFLSEINEVMAVTLQNYSLNNFEVTARSWNCKWTFDNHRALQTKQSLSVFKRLDSWVSQKMMIRRRLLHVEQNQKRLFFISEQKMSPLQATTLYVQRWF